MDQFHKKITVRFARSLSFPVPTTAVKPRPASTNLPRNHLSYEQRSLSLPARLHPIVSRIEEEIRSLRSWQHQPISPSGAGSPAWILDGLAGIDGLHSSLTDLLYHPQSQEDLGRYEWADRLLDDSLRFADAHGGFRIAIVALTDHFTAARSALRRRDGASLASALCAQKKTEKQLLKLAASLRSIGRSGSGKAELGCVAREVMVATALASASVFTEMTTLASAAIEGVSTGSTLACALSWSSSAFNKSSSEKRLEGKGERSREKAMRRMEAVEKCISEVEICNQRILRRMLNTRVFLLNARTPTL